MTPEQAEIWTRAIETSPAKARGATLCGDILCFVSNAKIAGPQG